ncbi:rhodanese-like domain-containing protein [Myxococcota bacterium]
MAEEVKTQRFFSGFKIALRDAVLITAASCAVGLLVNLFHPEKIPYIAEEEYNILVPCPEPGGEVTALEVSDPTVHAEDTFVVDARKQAEHQAWKLRDAMNIPYDYLEPIPDEALQELINKIQKSGARRVLVYGDGKNPDSGEQAGKEISGKGIKNVFYVKGGAPALGGPGGEP